MYIFKAKAIIYTIIYDKLFKLNNIFCTAFKIAREEIEFYICYLFKVY